MDDGEGLGASWFRVLIVWFDSPKWPSLGNLSPAWARRAAAARVPLTTFSTAQCLQKKKSRPLRAIPILPFKRPLLCIFLQ